MYYVCNVLRPCIGYTKFAGKCVHVSKHPFNDYNAASISIIGPAIIFSLIPLPLALYRLLIKGLTYCTCRGSQSHSIAR